jgi:hypothetical protein
MRAMSYIDTIGHSSPRDTCCTRQSHIYAILSIYYVAIYLCAVAGLVSAHWVALNLFASLAASLNAGCYSTGPS